MSTSPDIIGVCIPKWRLCTYEGTRELTYCRLTTTVETRCGALERRFPDAPHRGASSSVRLEKKGIYLSLFTCAFQEVTCYQSRADYDRLAIAWFIISTLSVWTSLDVFATHPRRVSLCRRRLNTLLPSNICSRMQSLCYVHVFSFVVRGWTLV